MEDTLGGQIGKVGLGWILKAVSAVRSPCHLDGLVGLVGAATQLCFSHQSTYLSLYMIFPALNPHSDYIP